MGRIGKEEINRKLLHILAVGFPVFIFYGPDQFGLTRHEVVGVIFCIFLFSLIIDLFRLYAETFRTWFFKQFGYMMRKQEETQLTGATYIIAGSLVCSWISLWSEFFAASAFLSLTLFILGDAAAALCGKAFGKIKVGEKTLEGTIGCFVLCLVISSVIFPQLPSFLVNWNGDFTWMDMIFFPLGIALLELFPIRFGRITLNDNLYVPAVVSLLILI